MSFDRRGFLFGSIGVGTALQWAMSVEANEEPSGEIVFEDQTIDGAYITVSEISTNIDSILVVRDEGGEPIYQDDGFEAGEYEDYRIELTTIITESSDLSVHLYPEGGGSGFGYDRAVVTVEDPPEVLDEIGPRLIEADPDSRFNFPYFLYAPTTHTDQDPRPLLVEPNNSGSPSDEFDVHLDNAEGAIESGPGRHIADNLGAPLLVPALPRPRGADIINPQNLWRTYLKGEDSEYARPDLQVIAMAEDARERLKQLEYPVDEDGLMLNGFSQSADWVGLFTALHPEEVRSVTAGGVNGMPILPMEEANGYTLEYHVGVANVEELIGRSIDVKEFANVNQFYYMGELDDSDTLPYFHDSSMAEAAKNVLGRHMVKDRFPYAQSVYEDEDVSAIFRVYEDAGHTPRPAYEALVEFHERSLADEETEAIRDDIGGNVPELGPHIEFSPNHPGVGDEITFDARRSSVSDRELEGFEWQFDEAEQTGAVVTHTFEAEGGHNVVLEATDSGGISYQTITQIVVRDAEEEIEQEPEPDGVIEISDQTSDGTSIIVERIETNVDATIGVIHYGIDEGFVGHDVEAGFEAEPYEIELDPLVTEGGEIAVSLYDQDGSGFARDTATLTIEDPFKIYEGFGPTLIEADAEAGFNYPYLLYAPPTHEGQKPRPLLVEPNNSPSPSDDFDVHLEAAEDIIEHASGRTIADEVSTPLLVPVFPRPWPGGDVNPQGLFRAMLEVEGSDMARPDLQLLAMIDNARAYLQEHGYPVDEDGVMLTGFSGSANTVNRFAALHPEEVHSVSAGGINGIPLLPRDEAKDRSLKYHVGVYDLEMLTGEPFDLEAFQDVPQFYYMGEIDPSDQLPYYPDESLFELTKYVYGVDMQGERFPFSRAVYDETGVSAIFRMYENTGHTPRPAYDDLIEFHDRVLGGENVDTLRADLGGGVPNMRANIQSAPKDPSAGEQVAFHAVDSEVHNEEITQVEWEIDQQQIADDWTFSTSFDEPGSKQVTLRVTTDAGESYETSDIVSIEESIAVPSESDEDDESDGDSGHDENDESDADDEEATEDDVPGFGIVGTITALGGAGYVLKRRLGRTEKED